MIDEIMNFMKIFKNTVILIILTFVSVSFAFAQTGEPRQEKLLNGLKIIGWTNPKDEKVSFKLRIHSGSVFDPKDKVGVMALLADILFPTDQTKEYFEQELEGSFVVTSTYEYIQIDASGKSDAFLSMLETLSAAVSNPQIIDENFVKVRNTRIELVKELLKNPNYVADKAVAKRLLGDYPYGRPQAGTLESLAKIDRPDVLFAKDKFLTSDNATLTISGNVQFNLALKASKQFFGGWKKADKLVPATFARPEEVDVKPLTIETELNNIYFATRGISRNDKNFFASQILINTLQNRNSKRCTFSQSINLLPSLITFVCKNDGSVVENFFAEIVKQDEFDRSKNAVSNEYQQKSLSEKWLDIDTYKLISVKDETQKLNNVTLADVQKVAEILTKQSAATVLPTKPAEQKPNN
jgi:predicted Zn-dependent peptidase